MLAGCEELVRAGLRQRGVRLIVELLEVMKMLELPESLAPARANR